MAVKRCVSPAAALSRLPGKLLALLPWTALILLLCPGARAEDFAGRPPLPYPRRRWRVRAAKGARLESVCGGDSTVGSNPTATAKFHSEAPVPKRTGALALLGLVS